MPWLLIVLAALRPSPPERQEPSKDDVKRATREILSSRDYDRRAQESSTGKRLYEKVRDWFDSLGGLWETSPILAKVLIGLLLGVLLAIIVHFCTVLYRSTRAVKEAREGRAAVRQSDDPRALLEGARKAGDVLAALTLYVQAVMAGLDRRGVVRLTETATVREYRGLLRARPADARLFERLMTVYEPGVFGRKPVSPEAVRDVDQAAELLIGGGA